MNITTPQNNSCQALVATAGNSTLDLQANLDIAGIGIIVSFIISAYIVLTISIVCYICGVLPDNLLNTYDRQFMKRKSGDTKTLDTFFQALAEGVLAFSDTQVIQGIAILVAAFVNITELTVYDWQIVVYLAWMSSNVHLTTLTFLRDYLNERPTLCVIRIIGMFILLVLLLVAFVPTSSYNWVLSVTRGFDRSNYPSTGGEAWYALNFALPSRCFWHQPFNGAGIQPYWLTGRINPDAPFTYLALIITYIWKMIALARSRWKSTEDRKDRRKIERAISRKKKPWLRRAPLQYWANLAKWTALCIQERRANPESATSKLKSSLLSVCFRVVCILFGTTLALFDFFRSFVASLWVLALLLVWGSLEVANVRKKALPDVHAAENEWNFGQILPMVLLVGPVIAISNHFLRDHDEHHSEETKEVIATAKKAWAYRKRSLQRRRVSVVPDPDPDPYRPRHIPKKRLYDYFTGLGEHDQPEIRELSLQYFYNSNFFHALLLLPNLMALAGGVVVCWLEGRSALESGADLRKTSGVSLKDPKGWVFEYIALIVGVSFAVWCTGAGVCMCFSRLFKH